MLNEAIIKWGIIAICLFTLSNGFFSTPPSEIVLTIAGALTVNNDFYFLLMLLLVVFSNYLGTTILYLLSRNKGKVWYDKIREHTIFNKVKLLDKVVPDSDNLIKYFNNQDWLVFACRFVPFIRSIISVPAGISKMNFFKYSIYSLAGIMVWSFVWLWVGRTTVLKYINGEFKIIFIFLIIFFLSAVWGNIIRQKLNK